jgi:hypothetical protein
MTILQIIGGLVVFFAIAYGLTHPLTRDWKDKR